MVECTTGMQDNITNALEDYRGARGDVKNINSLKAAAVALTPDPDTDSATVARNAASCAVKNISGEEGLNVLNKAGPDIREALNAKPEAAAPSTENAGQQAAKTRASGLLGLLSGGKLHSMSGP